MSTITERWLLCDKCGSTSRDGNVLYKSIAELRADCKRNGWTNSGDTDICWDCNKQVKED